MATRFSLFFDGSFWIGVLERDAVDGVKAVRHVFGPEPGNAELLAFMLGPFADMVEGLARASAGETREEIPTRGINPKRALREAAREQTRPLSTKSQAALAAAKEAEAGNRRADRSLRRREESARRFAEKTERRKEKRLGH